MMLHNIDMASGCLTTRLWPLQWSVLLQNAGLPSMFGIQEDVFLRFLRKIEEGYPWNNYHNR